MISISKAEHLPSFWNRGPGELGIGLIRINRWQKQFQCLSVVLNNKIGPLFLEYNRYEDTPQLFFSK